MALSISVLGFMVIDIMKNRLSAKFIDSTGATRDRFFIVKEDNVPDDAENGALQ